MTHLALFFFCLNHYMTHLADPVMLYLQTPTTFPIWTRAEGRNGRLIKTADIEYEITQTQSDPRTRSTFGHRNHPSSDSSDHWSVGN